MDSKIEDLKALGCDIEEALSRFLEDESFYLECLEQVIYDENFQRLQRALENHQGQQAFDCAHTLKGLFANLGLTSLSAIMEEIVEPLREGREEDLLGKFQTLMAEREKYVNIIAK